MQWGLSNVSRNDREVGSASFVEKCVSGWQLTLEQWRFASLDVHPNVDYAFHALALDEWRTAFGPTLWNRSPDNKRTELRQAWFPGSHSNVGGGFEDQQIATIALACKFLVLTQHLIDLSKVPLLTCTTPGMADQLTSVGVEFSKPEMQRIFYDVNPGVRVRPWGMGKIHNPRGVTTIPDKLFDHLPWRYLAGVQTPARKPGLYTGDGDCDLLPHTMESVHPSVRIRYLYDGAGLDDDPQWACRALTENGYALVKQDVSSIETRPSRVPQALKPYYSVGGALVPFLDDAATAKSEAPPSGRVALVRTEQPHENDLQNLPNPTAHWVWKKGDRVLPEEPIGMWERLYMKTNDKLLLWQGIAEGRKRRKVVREEVRARSGMSPLIRWLLNAWRKAGEPLGKARGTVARKVRNKVKPEGFDEKYGHHDMIVWQRGDTTPNHSARMAVGRRESSVDDTSRKEATG